MATGKTNAVRLLESKGIPFQLREYEVDPEDLSAETVAVKVGLPPEQVFKTLAVEGDRSGICLAVIPANSQLDPKALAKLNGDRKAEMLPLKDVLAVTGYMRGAVTAIGCKKDFPVVIDETVQLHDVISVSAGMRGLQLVLSPENYIQITAAKLAEIARFS